MSAIVRRREATPSAVDRLRQIQREARNREIDEILDHRIQIAHYYTGVADGLEKALDVLEEGR